MSLRVSFLPNHAKKKNGPKCTRGCKPTRRNTTAAMCRSDILKTHSLVNGLVISVIITRNLQRNNAINWKPSVFNGEVATKLLRTNGPKCTRGCKPTSYIFHMFQDDVTVTHFKSLASMAFFQNMTLKKAAENKNYLLERALLPCSKWVKNAIVCKNVFAHLAKKKRKPQTYDYWIKFHEFGPKSVSLILHMVYGKKTCVPVDSHVFHGWKVSLSTAPSTAPSRQWKYWGDWANWP